MQRVTSVQPPPARLWVSASANSMQVHGPSAVVIRREPSCGAGPEQGGFAEAGSQSPCEEGGPAGAPASPGCNGRPVTGSHSHPREEEFSHRLNPARKSVPM